MLRYTIGDVVRCRCWMCDKIVSGRILEADESSAWWQYLIKCPDCADTAWYHETNIIGPDRSFRPVWKDLYKAEDEKHSIGPWDFLFSKVPGIKKVIFNNPVTIVFWTDGTKTVVKARAIKTVEMAKDVYYKLDVSKIAKFIGLKSGQMYKAMYKGETDSFLIDIYDEFDPEKGLAMAIAKRALGNKGSYYDEFKKWLPKEE